MAERHLVTGGAGFIGSNLVRRLLDEGHHVVVLDKLTYAGSPENLAPLAGNARFELVRGDVCDRALVRSLLERSRPDVIFHLAAESHVDRSIEGPAEFVRTNVVGTFEMLDAALELGTTQGRKPRFVHVSTDEVYGSLGAEGRFDEGSPFRPSSPYAATKAASDHLARAYFRTYGLPVVTTHCSNNYGPYQFPEKLVPLLTLNALEQKKLPVYGDGRNVRDWLYVGDHCEALALVAERGLAGETYDLGGNEERTTLEMAHAVCDVLDEIVPRSASYRELVELVADRPGHDFRYAIDSSKIASALGWRARTPFREGIRTTVAWYVEHRERIAPHGRERLGVERVSR